MFRVGERVVCVDDSDHPLMGDRLVKGSTYTVCASFIAPECPVVVLIEAKSDHPNLGYRAARFRRLIPKSLEEDASEFRKLLNVEPMEATMFLLDILDNHVMEEE